MALVRLSSLEEALNGAALLHGKEVLGRKINVSFTKSKLCWKSKVSSCSSIMTF